MGNTRVVFTTDPKTIDFGLNYESNSADPDDEALFDNLQNVVTADVHDHVDAANESFNHNQVQLLNGATNGVVGSVLTVPVGPGDKVSAEVYAKYLAPTGTNNPAAAIGNLVIGAITGSTGTNNYEGAINSGYGSGGTVTNLINANASSTEPMAFINLLFLPDDVTGSIATSHFAFKQITSASSNSQAVLALDQPYEAPESGYVVVYLSNESAQLTEVYFDDLEVTVEEHAVIQTADYYPFGLTFNSFNRVTAKKNKFLHQGKELQSDLGLDTYDFHWRVYDRQLGRTWQQDPYSGMFVGLSPYSWVANNPIMIVDPDGRKIEEVEGGVRLTGRHARRAFAALCPECGGDDDEQAAKDEATYHAQSQSDRPGYVSPSVGRIASEFNYLSSNGFSDAASFFRDAYSSGDLTTEEIAQLARLRTELVGKIKAQYMAAIFSPDNVTTILGVGIFGFANPSTQSRLFGVMARGTGGQGFKSFSAFKRAFGSAGEGYHWHHIVEQTSGNVTKFGQHSIQNTNNLVRVKSTIHVGKGSISAHYSSIQPFTNGKTVRQWLSSQSFSAQRQYGLKILEMAKNGIPLN